MKQIKVQCGKCKWWYNSGRRALKRGSLTSYSFNYEFVGQCDNRQVAEEWGGLTGDPRGHSMYRREKVWRFCKSFEPNVHEIGEKE